MQAVSQILRLVLAHAELYHIPIPLLISTFFFVPGSVAVMTKAYPSIERNDLILLQEIASYMLLACGAVYVISVREFWMFICVERL
jgi:hypothetical protein